MSSAVNSMVQTNNEFNQALSKEKGNALDKDAFMLLLVTQFKYQDPLNPAEDKEFIAQLATFSSLEQLMNLNDSMEGLTTASMQGQMISATSYIGKNVDATGTNISKTTTDKDKNEFNISTFRYAIGEASVTGTMNIYDSGGTLVHTATLPPQNAGTYPYEWDGKTVSGTVVPDGIYRITPVFTNAEGKPIQYDAVVDGKVSGIITENGTTYLTLEDGRTVALANIRRVSETKISSADTSEEVSITKSTTDDAYSVSTLRYTLDEASARGSIKIYDKDKSLVNTYEMPSQAVGTHRFEWDGKNASGTLVPDGTYRMVPSFTNAAGKIIPGNAVVDGNSTGSVTGGDSGTETAKAA